MLYYLIPTKSSLSERVSLAETPWAETPMYGKRPGSMYPTGMHSC